MGLQGNGKSVEMSNSRPARVKYFANKGLTITQLTAGKEHIIALDEKGNVWGWGMNMNHQASGNNIANNPLSSPVLVLNKKNVVMVSTGTSSSYALTKSGDVYTWGDGRYGEIGNGTKRVFNNVNKLSRQYFNNRPVVLIGSGDNTGYAINNAGQVFGWGHDSATLLFQAKPKIITNIPRSLGKSIVYITGGANFTAFLTSSGDVYGMGKGEYLGLNISLKSGEKVTRPRRIIRNIKMLSCQYAGCVAVDNKKRLWTWGVEGYSYSRLLYGRTPTRRNSYGNVTKIDGGKEHIIYWNDKGKAYGIGNGYTNKFSSTQENDEARNWPGKELNFVVGEMKRAYGNKHILGQGK